MSEQMALFHVPEIPATDGQINFAQQLFHEREPLGQPAHLERSNGVEAAEDFINHMSKRDIGEFIGQMKRQPRRPRPVKSGKVFVGEGFYLFNDKPVQVRTSANGHKYSVILVNGGWVYSPGLTAKLRPENRLTVAQAQEYGKIYGHCACCGYKLTNTKSIELGIGPDCRKRLERQEHGNQ